LRGSWRSLFRLIADSDKASSLSVPGGGAGVAPSGDPGGFTGVITGGAAGGDPGGAAGGITGGFPGGGQFFIRHFSIRMSFSDIERIFRSLIRHRLGTPKAHRQSH